MNFVVSGNFSSFARIEVDKNKTLSWKIFSSLLFILLDPKQLLMVMMNNNEFLKSINVDHVNRLWCNCLDTWRVKHLEREMCFDLAREKKRLRTTRIRRPRAFGGKLRRNLARTEPLLPWARVTLPQMIRTRFKRFCPGTNVLLNETKRLCHASKDWKSYFFALYT